jgi:hypothetical protein
VQKITRRNKQLTVGASNFADRIGSNNKKITRGCIQLLRPNRQQQQEDSKRLHPIAQTESTSNNQKSIIALHLSRHAPYLHHIRIARPQKCSKTREETKNKLLAYTISSSYPQRTLPKVKQNTRGNNKRTNQSDVTTPNDNSDENHYKSTETTSGNKKQTFGTHQNNRGKQQR